MILLTVTSAIGQHKWLRFVAGPSTKLHDLQVFDDASRGPLGSFLLLFSIRLKSLAILGSIVTILSLGFDASVQSLILTATRTVFQNDTGASLQQITRAVDPGKL